LETDHGVIGDFLLGLQLSFKHHLLVIAIADGRHWALEKCVDVNAETGPKIGRRFLAHDCSSCCFRILAMIER
jgi:hypothetical protein